LVDESVTIELKGDRDCIAAFEELRQFIRGNLFTRSLRAAATLMMEEIIARAPVLTGKLVSNLRVVTRRTGGYVRGRVVINTAGGGEDRNNAFYWRFVEFGHRLPHDRGSGFVQPHPFVTPAFDARNAQSAQQVIDTFSEGLDKAEARAQRAGAR
jgi:HK97 gp10 family phage protein